MASLQDRMIRAARLDVQLYEEVEADQGAMAQATTAVILSAVAAGIGSANVGLFGILREAKITARLSHPHVLPLLDSGEADAFLYYVMPYVAGASLADRLDREKQLPLEDGLEIACKVGDALSYAHSAPPPTVFVRLRLSLPLSPPSDIPPRA